MRFLHTADWHIGKQLHDYPLVTEQWDAFAQLVKIAQAQHVDAIVIAGDVYDRSMPSAQAVTMVNQMMRRLNLDLGYPLLVISGNHDSAERLGVGRSWFKDQHFYLNTQLSQAFTPVMIKDTQFFLLPYFTPHDARQYFHDDTLKTMAQAMQRIVAQMQAQFVDGAHHVLVSHFFASGSTRTAAETALEVGGLAAVPLDIMDCFDYVALGHLHNYQALHYPRMRYSGSLLKFSVAEAPQQKGVWIVDTDPMQMHFEPLQPLNDIKVLTGSFAELTTQPPVLPNDAFVDIELTDQQPIPDLMNRLRQTFPHQRLVAVHRQHGLQKLQPLDHHVTQHLSPVALLAQFYDDVMQQPLTKAQQTLAIHSLEQMQKEK